MAITLAEVKKRLQAFVLSFKSATDEQKQANIFWTRFYECYGIRAEDATIYEQAVRKLDGTRGRIDSFIPGLLIVEHKSRGKDLDAAYNQASDYYLALKPEERPKFIITSDFARIQLHDLRTKESYQCELKQLPSKANWFRFLIDGGDAAIVEETPINREAAYAISKIHEALLNVNFKGRDLEVFLTRMLFCMFADDTGIFGENNILRKLVEDTRQDGADLGPRLTELFYIFDQKDEDRQRTLDSALSAFPYINGTLFSERTRVPAFDSELRRLLLECVILDWSNISPAIFGAMFQGVLEQHSPDSKRQETRRELGAHYTSERNILRVINPLFMDELRAELASAKRNKTKLQALYDKLSCLTFFDPACGCGNFLVITYREVRRLEMDVIEQLFGFDERGGRGLLDVATLCRVSVNQFYGIEIDEAAAHIARVALYITDHQLNIEAAVKFGNTRASIPLINTPHIQHANALQIDWSNLLPAERCSYVLGNPPFYGSNNQIQSQKLDMELVFGAKSNYKVLDYVCAWYVKAADYLQTNRKILCAFVSTSSITQGEQPAVLWKILLSKGIRINFAHRAFKWDNEGKGVAAVHCVIIGFSAIDNSNKRLYVYESISAEPSVVSVTKINAYLVEGNDVLLEKRRTPISLHVQTMVYGSKPADGGNLLLDADEAKAICETDETAGKFVRKFMGAEEYLHNIPRFCLWLEDSTAQERNSSTVLRSKIAAVHKMRSASTKQSTQDLAVTSYLFAEIRQTKKPYVLIPLHTSEDRQYIPFGFVDSDVICGNANSMLPNASLAEFGLISCKMHMAWVAAVCGRIKSDFRYSNTIVYNNYPFPELNNEKLKIEIETCAAEILNQRVLEEQRCIAANVHYSLATTYATGSMPIGLLKAHASLDRAVDKAFGYKGKDDDASRVAFLFSRYEEMTSLLASSTAKRSRSKLK